MKTDFSKLPREEIEARITTMLMGEMPAGEARELMEFVSGDAELMRLQDELKATISLVTEASVPGESMALSEGRREALLQAFKTVRPPELAEKQPTIQWKNWAAMAAMVGFLLGGASLVFGPTARRSARQIAGLADHEKEDSETQLRRVSKEETRRITVSGQVDRKAIAESANRGRSPSESDAAFTKNIKRSSEPALGKPAEARGGANAKIELPNIANDQSVNSWRYNRGDQYDGRGFGALLSENHFSATTDLPLPSPAQESAPDAAKAAEFASKLRYFNDQNSQGAASARGVSSKIELPSLGVAETDSRAKDSVGLRSEQLGRSFGESSLSGPPSQDAQVSSLDYIPAESAASKREEARVPRGFALSGDRDASAIDAVTGLPITAGKDVVAQNEPQKTAPVTEPEFVGVLGESEAPAKKINLAQDPAKSAAITGPRQSVVRAGLPAVRLLEKDDAVMASNLDGGNGTIAAKEDANGAVRRAVGSIEARRALERADTNVRNGKQKLEDLKRESSQDDVALKKPAAQASVPQPEISTTENAFSTFSLNVSDVSFKLAAASLEKGLMPDAALVRSEEFINAFDYRDPEPQGAPVGFVSERARYPFAQDRDLVRLSVKTAARGREAGRQLNLVLLLDSSGSMERADRVRILQECLKTLAAQLTPEDTVSVVAFARTARLWVDGLPGSQAGELAQRVGNLTPEGGTNLEEAMKVAYETARKHFNAGGVNRVVLLTDGAANLGDVEPESLKRKVEEERKHGVALDCFGIGWEGLNDELLETLSRNGDGRYGFVNSPEAAGTEFAGQLAGALQVAASDVKVQVQWNPKRVTAFRQIGYAKHQLTKEQFSDNTVDAAELGAAEAGNALYVVQVNAAGEGPLGTVRVRFKVPGTNDYREPAWTVDYDGASKPLDNSTYALRLAGTASAFSEWLASSPYAAEVTTDRLLSILSGVPEHFEPDPRPKKLEWMIRQAKSVAGK